MQPSNRARIPFLIPRAALAFALAGTLHAQSTWFVDDDGPGDPAPGNPFISDPAANGSSDHPYDRLDLAIASAASGDTILVRPSNPEHSGLHYFWTGTIDFSGSGAAKALTVRSTDGPESTVFEAITLPTPVPLFQAIKGETAAYVFEGFTLRNADNGTATGDNGGALVLSGSSPTIRDCRFENGQAYVGAGAYVNGSSSLFEDCVFSGNEAAHQGGAVYTNNASPTFSRCTFVGNTADYAGAFMIRTISGGAPRVLDCLFHQNEALAGYAGGLAKFDGGTVTVERTRFIANVAATDGGGMHVSGGGSVWDSSFDGNEGAGLDSWGAGTCTVHGSTLTANDGGGGYEGSSGQLVLVNSIVWGNFGGSELGSGVVATYSAVLGGFAGTGNIDLDPLFEDSSGPDGMLGTVDDDLSLMAESPCIDAGNALPLTTRSPHVGHPLDLARNPRAVDHPGTPDSGIAVVGQSVDMGAYEAQPQAKVSLRRW